MRALWLDYQQPPPPLRWPGAILLAIGIAVALMTVQLYLQTQEALETREFHVAQKKHAAERLTAAAVEKPAPTDKTPSLGRWLSGRDPAHWEQLFTAFEGTMDETVTLLSFEASEDELHINAEAKNYAAAASLVRRLQEVKAFSEVRLVSHETVKDHPQHPVRFTLSVRRRKAS